MELLSTFMLNLITSHAFRAYTKKTYNKLPENLTNKELEQAILHFTGGSNEKVTKSEGEEY